MARTGTLSGGNLQKALLARELAWDPLVLIAAQPTRGLDVGATQFVQGKFLELRAAGRGLIVISEDLEELLQISDRIAVMYGGPDRGRLPIAEASITTIGRLMAGRRASRPQEGPRHDASAPGAPQQHAGLVQPRPAVWRHWRRP